MDEFLAAVMSLSQPGITFGLGLPEMGTCNLVASLHASCNVIWQLAGVTMTLFCTHGRVSGPSSLLDLEVMAPRGYSVPCQF